MPNKQIETEQTFRKGPVFFSRLKISFLLLGAFILINGIMLLRSFYDTEQSKFWVSHSHEVISVAERVISDLKDAETGYRGYFISKGDRRYLEPYNAAIKEIDKEVSRLKFLVGDNPYQVSNVQMLESKISEKVNLMEKGVARRLKDGDFSNWDADLLNEGRLLMDSIRSLVDAIETEEKRLLELRNVDDAQSSTFVERSLYASLLMNSLLALLAYFILRRSTNAQSEESWLQERLADLAIQLSGDLDLNELGRKSLEFYARSLRVPISSMFYVEGAMLRRIAVYGFDETNLVDAGNRDIQEGLLGETARNKRSYWLDHPPADYLRVNSDLGSGALKNLGVVPIVLEGRSLAVMELGLTEARAPIEVRLIERSTEIIARNIAAAETRSKLQDLLEETQTQAEELQTQQEELRVVNEELTEQAAALSISQERLKQQQEELRQTNDQLEDQATILKERQVEVEAKAAELQAAKNALEEKAAQLEQASHYKSEFLANMSHELRTPLNSMLILATLLKENANGNLSEEQISFAQTIQNAGNDLLSLINDILDLSKVEAGKLDIYIEPVRVRELAEGLKKSFEPLAHNKHLKFELTVDEALPREIKSDQKRLEQILRNFLSNAFKFTDRGTVAIQVGRPQADLPLVRHAEKRVGLVAFHIRDSGIGIPHEKQNVIFEAFSQADTSTSRKYGGTGLGLTICRELATLLGGELVLKSELGEGSTFTLVIPESIEAHEVQGDKWTAEVQPLREAAPVSIASEWPKAAEAHIPSVRIADDRDKIQPHDKVVLIVEDDPNFIKILSDAARRIGFKVLCATDGEQALADLRNHKPSGILLDMKLPGVSGLGLIEAIKSSSETRHIPVHVISGVDVAQNALRMGALGYLMKPVSHDQLQGAFKKIEDMISRRVRRVLIVEDDERQRQSIARLIEGSDVKTDAVGLASEAQEAIQNNAYDCMILDLRLPDKSGLELLDALSHDKTAIRPPVIVYTGKDLSRDEILQLRRYSDSIIIKGVKSPERLVDEVSLFLHRVEATLPAPQQQLLSESRKGLRPFQGQKILLVDDDLRNTFALMSALEPKGLKVQVARNGFEALKKLEEIEAIDLVLMDIMMPGMDGYTAMREIRKKKHMQSLPIIALTAKAMRGDQEKCIEAGANDYLPKPIDMERLMSVLKAWLPQTGEF